MTMDEGVERFGEMFRDVPMIWRPDGMDEQDPSYQLFTRARVVEIWDKPAEGHLVLPRLWRFAAGRKDDFPKAERVFPVPAPAVCDAEQCQSDAGGGPEVLPGPGAELDDLTARISNIARGQPRWRAFTTLPPMACSG